MYSCCYLLLLLCCDYFIRKSDLSRVQLVIYLGCFSQKIFFFRIHICSAHASSDVIMVDHAFMFKRNRANFLFLEDF